MLLITITMFVTAFGCAVVAILAMLVSTSPLVAYLLYYIFALIPFVASWVVVDIVLSSFDFETSIFRLTCGAFLGYVLMGGAIIKGLVDIKFKSAV